MSISVIGAKRPQVNGMELAAPDQRRSDRLILAFCLFATLPVWASIYPRMTDLPQHAAQIALLKHVLNGQPEFTQEFRLHWFTPYLFGYLLAYGLSFFVKVTTALKILIALALAAVPFITSLLLRQAGIEEFWAILSIPGLYGFAYSWGLLNFLVAVPIGLLFIWVTFRHLAANRGGASLPIAAFAAFLFFCHALVCAFCLIIVSCYALLEIKPIKRAVLFILSLTPVIPIAGVWAWTTKDTARANRPFLWDLHPIVSSDPLYAWLGMHSHLQLLNGWGRLSGFFPRLLGLRSGLISAVIGIILLCLPVFGAGIQKRLASWIPFIVCMAVLMIAPNKVFGSDCVYQRFSIFVLPLFLLGIAKSGRRVRTKARRRAILLVTFCIIMSFLAVLAFNKGLRGFQQVAARMEPGQKALSMVFDNDDGLTVAPEYVHVPSWYSAEYGGIVAPSAAMTLPELVVYKPGRTPKAVLWDFEWNPSEFQWDTYEGYRYRYFIVLSKAPVDRYFSGAPCKIALRYHSDDWWLYEKPSECGSDHRFQQSGHPDIPGN